MLFAAPPVDGYTPEELAIEKELVIKMYNRLVNPMHKFIIMAHLELGYKQEDVAQMLGCSQANVSKKIRYIISQLRSIGLKRL